VGGNEFAIVDVTLMGRPEALGDALKAKTHEFDWPGPVLNSVEESSIHSLRRFLRVFSGKIAPNIPVVAFGRFAHSSSAPGLRPAQRFTEAPQAGRGRHVCEPSNACQCRFGAGGVRGFTQVQVSA